MVRESFAPHPHLHLHETEGKKPPQMPFLAPHSFLVGKKDKESVAGEVRTSTHTLLLLKALLMHNGSLAEQKDWCGENAV